MQLNQSLISILEQFHEQQIVSLVFQQCAKITSAITKSSGWFISKILRDWKQAKTILSDDLLNLMWETTTGKTFMKLLLDFLEEKYDIIFL